MEVVSRDFHVPSLDEVAGVFEAGLRANFATATASVVDCPDLTQAPFHLASEGICGSPRLADVGGVPNLVPLVNRDKVYNFVDVAKQIDLPGAFFLGAGAGSSRLAGVNCEMMPNTHIATHTIKSYFAKVDPEDGSMVLNPYSSNEFGLLGNFLASEGRPGKVIKVEAETRTGDKNFVTCMREALHAHFGDAMPVAIGGSFVIEAGNAKLHVMPDFSKTPLQSDDEVAQWLKFYECQPPLTCLSVFVSHDPGMDLRVDHTHCFSQHGQGGHYHYDVTPKAVKYTGYFVVAEKVFRVDAPKETHTIGRD
ncbi:uncharacterized protein MONBRDRAFT_20550 [Monosiga brevicollis MX1]|uniref:DUF1907 domain-containing protein n=1 Tax=Monosiga brevicollis TaxID=81824 RepID=A9UWD0_MONBE|nr:uncharacterized protein MONBRDRAFT_20550 [Monosiga brevicollis MX1]EDQ90541.1 predicted protein [Monosiga brevicollis MX1]|eukprot:XP_001744592.1 hypothetical protein [Monosiga brevicollis MX1]